MVTRNKIDGVNIRYEDREYVPAVCVKLPPLYPRMPTALQEAPDDLRNLAYELVQNDWWETVPQTLADEYLRRAFRGDEPETRSAGRSRGWVTVHGIDTPDKWTARKFEAWRKFESALKASLLDAEARFYSEIRERMNEK